MPDIEPAAPTRPAFAEPQRGKRVPLMAEFAIVSTLALIAAPILLVAGTLAAAARKRRSRKNPDSTLAAR